MKIQTAKDLAAANGCDLIWLDDGCSAMQIGSHIIPAVRGFWTLCISTDNPAWDSSHPNIDIMARDLNKMGKKAFMTLIQDALDQSRNSDYSPSTIKIQS